MDNMDNPSAPSFSRPFLASFPNFFESRTSRFFSLLPTPYPISIPSTQLVRTMLVNSSAVFPASKHQTNIPCIPPSPSPTIKSQKGKSKENRLTKYHHCCACPFLSCLSFALYIRCRFCIIYFRAILNSNAPVSFRLSAAEAIRRKEINLATYPTKVDQTK